MAVNYYLFYSFIIILLMNEAFHCYPCKEDYDNAMNEVMPMQQPFANPLYRSEMIMRNRRKCIPKHKYIDQLENPGMEDMQEYQRTKPDDIVVMFDDAIMIVVPQCNATSAPCPLDY